jgi:hypothetical protein
MATMGRYCKAYPINRFREFKDWTENQQDARNERPQIDAREIEQKTESTESNYLYLQEDFIVTRNIFKDEEIIFDRVTPEWIEYCKSALKFEIPVYDAVTAISSEQAE